MRQEGTALRDFNPAHVRFGSKAARPTEPSAPAMSGSPFKA